MTAVRRSAPAIQLDPAATDSELLGRVAALYHCTLLERPEALAFLARHGLDDPGLIRHFSLGYANRTLGRFLPPGDHREGLAIRGRLQSLGVLRPSGHEHLAGSLVAPGRDSAGRVSSLHGTRIVRVGTSHDLCLPDPARGLWNEAALVAYSEVIVCLGLVDALTFWVAGFHNVVAVHGRQELSGDQREAFRRHGVERVYLAGRRDAVGERAVAAVARELLPAGIRCARVLFPLGHDATAVARARQPAALSLRHAIDHAVWLGHGPMPAAAAGVAGHVPLNPLAEAAREYVEHLAVRNYSPATAKGRRSVLRRFVGWARTRGVETPARVTLILLEAYQQDIASARRRDGRPWSWGGQTLHLSGLRQFFAWCTRQGLVRANSAAALLLPRRPHRLPRDVLTESEVEAVLARPDVATVLGLRDRALLELLYSTGLRRMELIRLRLADLDGDRGVCFVREGKGGKDRVVPVGSRAVRWLERYLADARPALVAPPDEGTLFLTRRGRPLATNRLSELVHRYVRAAGLGPKGSCHAFRHTVATLLLRHGADIRHIQELLGHADLRTTAQYTQVAITDLKAMHQRAHPAERAEAQRPES